MYYIDLDTLQYPLHQGDIRLKYPDIGETFVLPDTYAEVTIIPFPEYDERKQWLFPDKPTQDESGNWTQNWIIKNYTEDELVQVNKWFEEHDRHITNTANSQIGNINQTTT